MAEYLSIGPGDPHTAMWLRDATRKEELLMDADDLSRVWILRKFLSDLSPIESMELLLDKMRGTKSNKEFLKVMNS